MKSDDLSATSIHIRPKQKSRGIALGLALGFAALSVTGCGTAGNGVSGLLSTIQVKTYMQNGDLWSEMIAQLDTGAMILAGINIPVVDPHNPTIVYGNLSVQSNFCTSTSVCAGGGQLTIAVNITQISHVNVVSNLLPNNTAIPVGNAATAATVALPIGNTGAILYVAMGQGIALLGVALPFKALDPVGQYVPGVDIFQPFSINTVNGIVGMFTGSTTNSTGVALFVDLSSLLAPAPQPTASASPTVLAAASRVLSASRIAAVGSLSNSSAPSIPIEPLQLTEIKPSSAQEQAVYYQLWKRNSNRTHLQLN